MAQYFEEELVGEEKLKKQILLGRRPEGFPHLKLSDWDVVPGQTNYGRGDLVFTNEGETAYMVVEVKYLRPTMGCRDHTGKVRNRKAKRSAEEQAVQYADHIRERYGKPVQAAIYINDLPAGSDMGP